MDAASLKRLQDLIDRQHMTHKSVSLAAGLSAGTVNTWFPKSGKGGVDPGAGALAAVANVLQVPVGYILTGMSDEAVHIPIVGFASAGEGWQQIDAIPGNDVTFDAHRADAIAIEVRGDSMSPVYRDGEFLVCSRRLVRAFDNLIGLDCVVMTKDGNGFVKILKRGAIRGKYNLKSYRPHVDDLENVELEWAAPVEWVRRGRR